MVKLLMCDNASCKCGTGGYMVGENGIVDAVDKQSITVECAEKHGGFMDRRVMFSRESADAHLELLSK